MITRPTIKNVSLLQGLLIYVFISNLFCTSNEIICCKEDTQFREYQNSQKHLIVNDSISNVQYLADAFKETGMYFNTGFHFYKRGQANYFGYLNASKDSLVFINLLLNETKKISTAHFIDKNQKYTLRIINDTLHLVNTKTYTYSQVLIDSDFTLRSIKTLDLKFAFNSKKYFVNTNVAIDKKLIYEHPYLFLTYGNFKTKNNADSKAIMKINLETKTSKKILNYPAKYQTCDMFHFYSAIENISDSTFVLVFQKMDFLALVNKRSNNYDKVVDSFFNSQFMCYNSSKEENLAYTSKFFDNDESNDNLIYSNNNLYLIKQLRKAKRTDPPKVAILIFDNLLAFKSTIFADRLLARLSFPYNKGVAILNDSLNKVHYYDLSK